MNAASNNQLEAVQTPHARVWHVTCWTATAGMEPFVFSVLSFDFWKADISTNIFNEVAGKKSFLNNNKCDAHNLICAIVDFVKLFRFEADGRLWLILLGD